MSNESPTILPGTPAVQPVKNSSEFAEIEKLEQQYEQAQRDAERLHREHLEQSATAERARKSRNNTVSKAAADAAKRAQDDYVRLDEAIRELEKEIRDAKVAAGIIPPTGWCYMTARHRWYPIRPDGYSLGDEHQKEGFSRARAQGGDDTEHVVENTRCVHGESRRLVKRDGVVWWNVYKPPVVLPVQGDWSAVRKVISNLCNDDADAMDFLIGWTAAPIQSLARRGRTLSMDTAVVLTGPQGSGKDTYFGSVRAVVGRSNTEKLDQDAMESQFSREGLADKQLLLLDEANSAAGIWDTRVQSKLKEMITGVEIPVRPMYKTAKMVKRHFNIVIAGNGERTTRLDPTDRRHTVIRAERPLEKDEQDQVVDRDIRALFQELRAVDDFEDGGREGLPPPTPILSAWSWHLHNLPSDKLVRPGQLYRTSERLELIGHFVHADDAFFEKLDEQGIVGIVREWETRRAPAVAGIERAHPYAEGELWRYRDDPPGVVRGVDARVLVEVLPSRLHALFIDWCGIHGRRENPVTENVFAEKAFKRYGEGQRRRMPLGGTQRPRVLAAVLLKDGKRQGMHFADETSAA